MIDDEIATTKKFLEKLKEYNCGKHKQLEKQILNRIKFLEHLKNEVLK